MLILKKVVPFIVVGFIVYFAFNARETWQTVAMLLFAAYLLYEAVQRVIKK